MDLPPTPNLILLCDPGTLLLGIYMKETNPVSQRYLALPVLRHNVCMYAMRWTQMLVDRRVEDDALCVHSGELFNHREWNPVIDRKMDRIIVHYGKWHEPDTGKRDPRLLSQLWEYFVFEHPPECNMVITKDWKDIGEGRLDKPRLDLVNAFSVYMIKYYSQSIEMYSWYVTIKF